MLCCQSVRQLDTRPALFHFYPQPIENGAVGLADAAAEGPSAFVVDHLQKKVVPVLLEFHLNNVLSRFEPAVRVFCVDELAVEPGLDSIVTAPSFR